MVRKIIIVMSVTFPVVLLVYCINYNIRIFYVSTGSMSPVIPADSLIVSSYKEPVSLHLREIIVFNDVVNRRITAHRIQSTYEDKFTTKGDANDYEDKYLVRYVDVIGKVFAVVPLQNYLYLISQLIFILLSFPAGVLIRKFLLFLIMYGKIRKH